jgi:TolA-binding protein
LGLLLLFYAGSASGCAWDQWQLWKPTPTPEGPADVMILRGDKLEPDMLTKPTPAAADLAGAQELYRSGDFEKAREIFALIANNNKNPAVIAEEARFYEAECLRHLKKYPSSADTFHKMLIDYPAGAFREQAVARLFDIADYWLEDTRKEMDLVQEKKAGKRSWVIVPVTHLEKEKPFLDEEGRALQALDWIYLNDITGPLAPKALFWAGSVKFFREDYREADHYFTQLTQLHPRSPLAPRAFELGIIAKQMSTGGAEYDGTKVAEARAQINNALANYPALANDPDKRKFFINQLGSITAQQAQKDFDRAEFYKRTSHPGAAYFMYELVRRRYPGTDLAEKSTQRMLEIRAAVEKEQQKKASEPAAPNRIKPGEGKPADEPLGAMAPGGPEVGPSPRPLPPNVTGSGKP